MRADETLATKVAGKTDPTLQNTCTARVLVATTGHSKPGGGRHQARQTAGIERRMV